MSQIIMPRRRFFAGLIGLVAAPMVVRASALMPVKAFKGDPGLLSFDLMNEWVHPVTHWDCRAALCRILAEMEK